MSMPEAFKKNMNKIVAPVAVSVGLGAAAYHAASEKDIKPETTPVATVTVHAAGKFEGSDSDWGQGTAERVIKSAVEKALANISGARNDASLDVRKVIETLPVYDEASTALDMAGYDEVLPDRGDVLSVGVEVSLDPDNNISYEVTDAEIEDIPNNN